ncbi:MAG: FkbM family methyltransferase [bacterium]
MSYELIKKISRQFGLYRQARWFNRHLLNKKELELEKSDLAFYSTILKKGDLVFDVGANYGEKTRIFLKLGAKVISIEPQSDCMTELKSRCGNSKNLITVQSALASKSGTGKFFVRTHRDKSGLIKDWQKHVVTNVEESIIDVPLVTLDEMINKYGIPVFIKIDVEGYEYEVLKGLTHAIPIISFEYHFNDNNACGVADCVNYLSQLGDILLNITPAEKLTLKFARWLTKDDFLNKFFTEIKNEPGFGYGDIWAKIQQEKLGSGGKLGSYLDYGIYN